MNYSTNMAKTPGGATLGEKIKINGCPGIHYKAGKREEDLTMEQLVECASGMKVKVIVYDRSVPELV